VPIDPIKPALKASGTERLELIYDRPLSNFAFNFKLRRYIMVASWAELPVYALRRKRYGLFAQCAAGMVASWGAFFFLRSINPVAAFWTVAMPFLAGAYTRSLFSSA